MPLIIVEQSVDSSLAPNFEATPTFLFFDINGTVIVEHFSKLVNYTDKEVSFVSKNKQVYIYGNDLTIMYFSKSEMTVEGNIEKIEIFEV